MLPSTDGSTLLFAPLIVMGTDADVLLFDLITAGFGENSDHGDDAVLLKRTLYEPKERTVTSFPVKVMMDVPFTIVFTPFVRVAIVTPSFCHS